MPNPSDVRALVDEARRKTLAGFSAEFLREWINYDPATGIFTWAKSGRGLCIKGNVAGCVSHGLKKYWKIRFKDKQYFAHRLAWLWMTGEWPAEQMDHIDGNSLNNRWSNLRAATSHQNCRNAKLPRTNTTGFKGV